MSPLLSSRRTSYSTNNTILLVVLIFITIHLVYGNNGNCSNNQHRSLINPYARVPQSVVGCPRRGFEVHCEETEMGSGEDENYCEFTHEEDEPSNCVGNCPNNWESDNTNTCYACGITYCLECDMHNHCTKCRDGTLVNGSICLGFYDVMYHKSKELICKEEEEKRKTKKEKLELTIILPILCLFAILVFFVIAVLAHLRYPHVGHQKRHRNPQKKMTIKEDSIEDKFRPQSSYRFR